MSYSNTRLRRVLAVVRIAVGLIFVIYGATKLFDPSFFATGFTGSLTRMSGTAADWYFPIVHSLWSHPGAFAVLVGMVELFLGIGLVLGLATRPVCLVGMIYMLNRIAITWYPGGHNFELYQYIDVHLAQLSLFFLFLLFAVGHAGETWGLGAIYHHERFDNQRSSLRDHPDYRYLYEPEKDEEKKDDQPVAEKTKS